MITIDVADETTGRNYTATIHADERVTIDCDGSRAGTGRLHQDRIVDCDIFGADLRRCCDGRF